MRSRVGGQQSAVGLQHHFFLPRVGGSGQQNRGFRPLAPLEEGAKLLHLRLVLGLEEAVVFQVAGEVQARRAQAQLLQTVIIAGRAGGHQVI